MFVFGNQGLKCETQKCKFFQDVSSRENIHYPHDHKHLLPQVKALKY